MLVANAQRALAMMNTPTDARRHDLCPKLLDIPAKIGCVIVMLSM